MTQADVFYLRYQDDIVIFCKSSRQLNRCKQKVMSILSDRKLRLPHKKSRIGLISEGFHFLGVNYLKTQPQDKTRNTCAIEDVQIESNVGGG